VTDATIVTIGTALAAPEVARYTMDLGSAPAAEDTSRCTVRRISPTIGH
jgi:hypothetical protein